MNFKCKHIALIVVMVMQLLMGCYQGDVGVSTQEALPSEQVIIKRSQFGIAHIKADSLYGLGYGNAYAQAQDHACILADGYLRIQGQRAKYLGADKQPDDNYYVISDFGYRILDVHGRTERAYAGLSEQTKALAAGFAAGYNAYLAAVERGDESLASECAGEEWVKPITAVDVVANILMLGVQSSAGRFMPAMVRAHPGTEQEWLPKLVTNEQQSWPLAMMKLNLDQSLQTQGSNGWALGKEKTRNGKGILLANPHFPFSGNFRFWAHQAELSGKMNVMGASVVGFPGVVNIGFNNELAWTHTFSAAKHAVIYRLSLDPKNPLRYQIDGQWQEIEPQEVELEVKTASGPIRLVKTIYRTDVGIVIEDAQRFPWDNEFAYVIKETNLDSFDAIDHWLALNQADSMAEFKATFKHFDGMLFNNTLAVDKLGSAFYIDDSNVPALSTAALQLLSSHPQISQIFKKTGMPVLPGDKSELIYSQEVDFENAPQLERTDYVQNANDSYWLTNGKSPLHGYSPLYGKVNSQQSLRTRQSLAMLEAADTDGLFNGSEVEIALLNNETYFERFMPDLLRLCADNAGQKMHLKEDVVSVDPACNAVKLWDGTFNLTARSAHLILEFAEQLDFKADFSIPFDPIQPQITPRVLRQTETVLRKLLIAAKNVETAGFSLTEELSKVQFVQKGEQQIPWPGAAHRVGGFNVFSTSTHMDLTSFSTSIETPIADFISGRPTYSGLSKRGFDINFGSSWMMVVEFTDNGPQARGLLSFSQSANSHSAHFADQSHYYSNNAHLIDLPFTADALATQITKEQHLIIEKD
ncbi:penicillin acylase family protein [Pseudoalteromonas ostreae]|uniref:penicillin acylase family protein n=1 Tax=Pseudoalteromonas ostreae TaxID=2774154 RepID=UPI001B369330|nr:penicillin acylase family protein [Pseudoalteromonas ostreae]